MMLVAHILGFIQMVLLENPKLPWPYFREFLGLMIPVFNIYAYMELLIFFSFCPVVLCADQGSETWAAWIFIYMETEAYFAIICTPVIFLIIRSLIKLKIVPEHWRMDDV